MNKVPRDLLMMFLMKHNINLLSKSLFILKLSLKPHFYTMPPLLPLFNAHPRFGSLLESMLFILKTGLVLSGMLLRDHSFG